ncbi:F0F1 ATP synthase subunit B' domain protein [Leptotrichia wadei F0279]|uniref:F0F1 ATP synthase subunit B' domain protein n=1 Tax=Leptotrichia wadei (strain F0279) TaxID=888055 RepID=U2RLT6_LEPWF|nr:F0F1 ATP synthase subunit B' domain protein [Leptotrichia wadei F0279]
MREVREVDIKEKMKKNKLIEIKIIEILKENNVTLRDFDIISNSVKMKFVEAATLKNGVSETVKKNELRIDMKLNTEEIEKLIKEFSKRISGSIDIL